MLLVLYTNNIHTITFYNLGHAVALWLRHCATNRKVAVPIPDDVTGFFY
jgi:hypothetical protein